MFDESLSIAGKVIQIPARLLNIIRVMEKLPVEAKLSKDIFITGQEDRENTLSELDSRTILEVVNNLSKVGKPQEEIFALGIFANKLVADSSDQASPQAELVILADALRLEYQALPYCGPQMIRIIASLAVNQAEKAIRSCILIGSVGAIISAAGDITTIFDSIETGWEPELREFIMGFKQLLPQFLRMESAKGREQISFARDLSDNLIKIRKTLGDHSSSTYKKHHDILLQLTEAWLQNVQAEILLIASAEYGSEGLDPESVSRQAQILIGQVENRLRVMLERKYREQFGESWLEHIKAKHKSMYEYWAANLKRDQAAFKSYGEQALRILDYARFEDLTDLIAAQWHLFKDVFDFGYEGRNKSIFYDKMGQIARVRNPLAHHRTVPENELLRARVLCMDILLAFDRAREN